MAIAVGVFAVVVAGASMFIAIMSRNAGEELLERIESLSNSMNERYIQVDEKNRELDKTIRALSKTILDIDVRTMDFGSDTAEAWWCSKHNYIALNGDYSRFHRDCLVRQFYFGDDYTSHCEWNRIAWKPVER